MDENIIRELEMKSASKVHADWCMSELRAYYGRAQSEYQGNLKDAYNKACLKNGKPRNEVELDTQYLMAHSTLSNESIRNFDAFMSLFNAGAIDVKRFTKRNLTEGEIQQAGRNYRDGEENILRPFSELSHASQEENLSAAIGAVRVFTELAKAGVTIDEMKNNAEMRHLIGVAIHLDWIKRNPNHPNDSLKVPYDELDEWTQQQDLTVFDAMLDVVMSEPSKYRIAQVDGVIVPDYEELEKEVFGHTKKIISIIKW